jgi:hypothetical protein
MTDGTVDQPLYLVFLPYLTMSEPVEFGSWWLEPLQDFDGDWPSDRFRDLSLGLVGAFRDPSENSIEWPVLLAHTTDGVTGELPEQSTLVALQRAIHYGSLMRNPPWAPDDGNEGLWTSTSDNSEIVAWPIDLDEGRVTVTRGTMVRIQALGYTIGPELVVRAPLELHLPWPRPFDNESLAATYEVLSNEGLGERLLAHRIGMAIDWLAHAWRNSRSISFESRIVMLKTAFDALTGTDKTYEAATWLEDRFRALENDGVDDDLAEELLWSPSEEPRHLRTWGNGNTEICTDLAHWFHALGTARNEIVHAGAAAALTYEMKDSAYQGPLSNVAERFLRETVQVCLRDFGFDDLWQPHAYRMIKRALEEAMQEGQDL